MIAGACERGGDGGIIPQVLGAVDCQTRGFAQAGYQALTGLGSPFQAALTALLTIYIAVLGYRLLFGTGGARLADTPAIAIKVGAILALTTNWSLFQTLVFDLVATAPLQLASLIATPVAVSYAADPVAGLQGAHDVLMAAAQAFGKAAGPMVQTYTSPEAGAAKALQAAANALFAGAAGVTAVATLAIGVLTAVGPVFVALFLFRQTRGLFVGWIRALLAAAFAPFAAWIVAVLMLAALEPHLAELVRQIREAKLDPETATTTAGIVFVFSAAEAALLLGGLVIALGLRLDLGPRAASTVQANLDGSAPAPAPQAWLSRPERLAQALRGAGDPQAAVRGGWAAPGAAARRVEPAGDPTAAAQMLARRPGPRSRLLQGSSE